MKKKLFTSTNSKKGVLLESGDDKITISIWKKETPISVEIDRDTVLEINDFIVEEFGDNEDADKVAYWSNYVKEFTASRVNKTPDDLEQETYDSSLDTKEQ